MALAIDNQTFARLAASHYRFSEVIRPLAGYDDLNLLVRDDTGMKMVLKLSSTNFDETPSGFDFLLAQNEVLADLNHLPGLPKILPNLEGGNLSGVTLPDGSLALMRALSYIEGEFLTQPPQTAQYLESLGAFLGELDSQLVHFDLLPFRQRRIPWDLRFALDNEALLPSIKNHADRRLAAHFFRLFRDEVLPLESQLPRQTIHNDANDHNLLCEDGKVSGIIDFGDMVHSWRVGELAIALAYALFEQEDPLEAACTVVAAYQAEHPLQEVETRVLFPLIATRLAVSVARSAHARKSRPEQDYLYVSESLAWSLLRKLLTISPDEAARKIGAACGFAQSPLHDLSSLETARDQHFSRAMSLSYRSEPLFMERAALQYMYARDGRAYLDGVNNIMHVGHCHPRVVEAGQRQMGLLNTNTRYLYPQLSDYAEKLCATLPAGLEKVFFVNSGSAATDLALRLARAHTGRKGLLVLEHGYHGNTTAGIEVSAYKYRGKGGSGPAGHIFEAPLPDLLRGSLAGDVPATTKQALETAAAEIQRAQSSGNPIGAFIGETIVGCGGQVMLPEGYLAGLYAQVRAAGGLCVADEVQTGFGRVGSHFWAFEQHGVHPDMVILGKPMGNGHPMAAVVCRAEIAASFENGMEFFSSFGGNPVSCAIGMAVLEVIEEEGLQAHAEATGRAILEEWREMQREFEVIGDVRGTGLFLGLELVKAGGGMEPDGTLADMVVLEMRRRGILLSTDGPWHNVIKFKPPMPFNQDNAAEMNRQLREVIQGIRDGKIR